jgi:tetratricopeptide (TPR) repeat protein
MSARPAPGPSASMPGAGRRALGSALAGLALFALASAARADDSPKYAERGIAAYSAGKYDLARMFFAKALQDAVLKGKEEWIAKATLNLADLELESGEEEEADRLLEGLAVRDKGLRSLWYWKRSQSAFGRRHGDQAVALIDSALRLAKGDPAREIPMRADRLRYLIQSREPSAWTAELESWRKLSGKRKTPSIEALAAMSRKDFARADSLWRQAGDGYREQGRLAKAAACMNQSALCLFSLGRREEALEANGRAVAIYGELGLELPGLKAQALRLLLVEDESQLAKLRQDMDLVGQRFSGFDLQGILDEYSHSLRDGRGLGGVVGPVR